MRPIGDKIVIASHNEGKVREIGELLAPHGVTIASAKEFGLSSPAETEATFAGNARIKAHYTASETGLAALSDDSGLLVDALNGEPGVHAADWAETPAGRDFSVAMERVHRQLLETGAREPWTARFVCVLCLAWPDGEDVVFEGTVKGRIVWPMRGNRGFGYDPIFLPDGERETFGEMDPARKHAMSHRADAFAKFTNALLV